MTNITLNEFTSRFAALVLGGGGALPQKPLDRHILYLSATLGIEPGRTYAENELNAVLIQWVASFGDNFGLDHVSLRRYLVDEGYLRRDSAGRFYELALADLPYTFYRPVEKPDLVALVEEMRTARELRKRQYTARQE